MKTRLLLIVSLFATLLFVPAGFAVTYTTFDFPGAAGNGTFANGINLAGDIVGGYQDTRFVTHGFLVSGGVYTTLDPPGSLYTFATGINDLGEIVGYYIGANAYTHGFVLQGQTYTTFDFPGTVYTEAFNINNAGQIVGYYRAEVDGGLAHGFQLSNGIFTVIDVPNAANTYLLGINNKGDLFGVYSVTDGGTLFGLVQVNGIIHTLTTPQGGFAVSGKINDHRQVISSLYYNLAYTPLLFHAPSTYTKLQNISTLQPPRMLGWGINNNGAVVGYFLDIGGRAHAFLGVN